MYTGFYNLREKPFSLNPSPRFLYLSESHKEALALLAYGVMERKGFILLTGEVGTGKTTIVQALLGDLDDKIQCTYLSNPLLSPREFMNYVAISAFGKKVHFDSKADFLLEFEEFLRKCQQHQKHFILIIDEAQTLSFELLEEIRLLSNLESSEVKLINIFLVGQPELNDKLLDLRCRPLLQRISIRHHIRPLNLEETKEYMATRLKVAGAAKGSEDIFSKASIKAIHDYSRGYPRMINILADNSLLLGYARGKRRITPSIVQQSYEDMKPSGSSSRSTRERPDPYEIRDTKAKSSGLHWKWVAVALVILVILVTVAVGVGWRTGNIYRNLSELKEPKQHARSDGVVRNPVLGRKPKPLKEKNSVIPDRKEEEEIEAAGKEEKVPESNDVQRPEELAQTMAVMPESGEESFESMVVKRGDTLAELAISVYGRADERILNLVQRHNPEINDVDRIEVGQKIIFPPLSDPDGEPIITVHIASYKPFPHAYSLFRKMMRDGFEAYIIPSSHPRKGTFFRVTLGAFDSFQKAENHAAMIIEKKISDYAQPIRVQTR